MPSKKRCQLALPHTKPALRPMPAPKTSQDVVTLLRRAAGPGLADHELVSHLAEMGALFPNEMVRAFKAVCARQSSDN
jgi:hypothetical protein